MQEYLHTNANQFGFKAKHGTDQAVYILKELIASYQALGSSVFICFLDASKAFDRVNHNILFEKLHRRGVPEYLLRIIVYWYVNQEMCVRWGITISTKFKVTNSVRQGGIISGYLYNVYSDDLSSELNRCNIGLYASNLIVNHVYFADDLSIMSPSSKGLKILLKICEEYGLSHDVIFNTKKSVVMIIRSTSLKSSTLPLFKLNGNTLQEVSCFSYLGCLLSKDNSDNYDIERQRKQLCIRGNVLLRKFHMCTVDVKVKLFKTFCAPLYCSHLWYNYSQSVMKKFTTVYHNLCKRFTNCSKYDSTGLICTVFNIPNCESAIRRSIYSFMNRLDTSLNLIIVSVLQSSLRYTERLRLHWWSKLFVNFCK